MVCRRISAVHPRRFVASLAVGLLAAVVAAVWMTYVLTPFVRPSALVGVLAGSLFGVAVAVLAYRRLDGHHPDASVDLLS